MTDTLQRHWSVDADQGAKGSAFDAFHYEIWRTGFRGSVINDSDDVWMLNGAGGSRFRNEAIHKERIIAQRLMEHLDHKWAS
jgi:hypothetical protein